MSEEGLRDGLLLSERAWDFTELLVERERKVNKESLPARNRHHSANPLKFRHPIPRRASGSLELADEPDPLTPSLVKAWIELMVF